MRLSFSRFALISLFLISTTSKAQIYIESDLTSSLQESITQLDNWIGASGYTSVSFCPKVTTNAGLEVQVCERYETNCNSVGDVFYQNVDGLLPGIYRIELYGAAAYTYGRGFTSTAFSEGTWNSGDKIEPSDEVSTGVVLYAETSEDTYGGEIPIYYATNFPDGAATVVLENVVVGSNGTLKIGMSKTSTSTNWHVIQLKGITAMINAADALAAVVAKADAINEEDILEDAYNTLRTVVDEYNKEYDTAEEYQTAIEIINEAVEAAMLYTYSSLIVNGDCSSLDGWEYSGVDIPEYGELWRTWHVYTFGNYSNESAQVTQPFIERWVYEGTSLSDGVLKQTIAELPNGYYRIEADIIACQQGNGTGQESGAYLFVESNGQHITQSVNTLNGIPKHYYIDVLVVDNNLTIGLETINCEMNWIAVDNWKLTRLSDINNWVPYPSLTQSTSFTEQMTVEILVEDGLIAYYTTDGKDPTTKSTLYSEPFIVNETTIVKAIAVDENGNASLVVAETYTKSNDSFIGINGKCYLQNIGSEYYLGAANSWGTQASLVEHPEYVTIIGNDDGTYKIESQVSNGGTAYYFNGSYMDNSSPVSLTITSVDGSEFYTIANGTTYYGYDGSSTVLGVGVDPTTTNGQWRIISEADMLESLANATADAPMDATFLIEDHDFGRNNRYQNHWTMDASNQNLSGGNNINNCAESYHSVFTLSQTLEDAPAGVYALTAQGFYRQDGEDNDNLPVFYANDETATFPAKTGSENSMSDASVSFSAGNYTIDPIYVKVEEGGTLTIGAKLKTNTSLWCIWDNFVLTYYGSEANVGDITYDDLIVQVDELKAKAEEYTKDEDVSDATKDALNQAIDSANEIESTRKAYNDVITALTAANNQASLDIKNKPAIDAMYDLMESTNVYTAEAYETYKAAADAYKTLWANGTLTETVVNPSSQTGWHAANNYDDLLLSAWSIDGEQCKDFDKALYINTWSIEGESDGSDFKVPFFEYWTGEDNSLGAKTLTGTVTGLSEGKYLVNAWVRIRAKNGYTAPAYGITMDLNGGDKTNVAAGEQVGTSQFFIDQYTAVGRVAADGILKVNFNVAENNNISWLSFKNVKYSPAQTYEINIATAENGIITANVNESTEGETITLTISPAEGYKVGSLIIKAGDENIVVSDDYTFTMPANDVTISISFTPRTYSILYVVDGQTVCDTTAIYGAVLTPLPNPTKEGYTFSGWSEIPDTMPAHDVTITGLFTLNDDYIDSEVPLSGGWEWFSLGMADTELRNPQALLEPILESLSLLKSQDYQLVNDPQQGLLGDLTEIVPGISYKLLLTEDVQLPVFGQISMPETTAVTLQSGWNWLGYLPKVTMSLTDALSNLQPSEGDVIKSQTEFSTFENGTWNGTLTEMTPCEGYLYYAINSHIFYYPTVTSSKERVILRNKEHATVDAPWQTNIHAYPDNMTLVARLMVEDECFANDRLVIAAFCDDECRGIGRLVNGLFFMTIHGSNTLPEQIHFRAYDKDKQIEMPIVEHFVFSEKAEGCVNCPFLLHVPNSSTIADVGINDLPADAEYYTLQGIRVKSLVSGHTYIVTTKSNTSKVVKRLFKVR